MKLFKGDRRKHPTKTPRSSNTVTQRKDGERIELKHNLAELRGKENNRIKITSRDRDKK